MRPFSGALQATGAAVVHFTVGDAVGAPAGGALCGPSSQGRRCPPPQGARLTGTAPASVGGELDRPNGGVRAEMRLQLGCWDAALAAATDHG